VISDIRAGSWRWPASAIFALCAFAMGVVLFWVGQWLTIWFDEWNFIFGRQSGTIDDLIRPHVDGMVVVPAAVYYVLLHIWGLTSYYPFLIVNWLAHFACVGLLGLIVTRKSGVLVGLMAALSLLFLGSAFEALLQPFQMQYLFSAAGGLTAFLLLDRDVRTGPIYVAAALALLFAIASSGVGPIITGMVFVWALLRRDRGALLAAVPALVTYGIWYFAWLGQLHRVAGTAENLGQVPVEVLYGIGAAVAGVTGLPPLRFAWVGLALAVVVGVALLLLAARRGLRPTPLTVAALFALVVEYGLQAVFRGAMGLDHGARSAYLYPAAIFIWLAVAGTIGRRLDPRRWTGGRRLWVPALIGLLVVPMALGNMTQLVLAARAMHEQRATELRELGLMVRLRDSPGLAMDVTPDPAFLAQVTARDYFLAIDRFGTPQIAIDRPADDLPGPDGSALNAVAMRLLGAAVTIGPSGQPGPAAPVLNVISGIDAPDDAPACTLLTTASGQAQATWSPSATGVLIRIDGPGEVTAFTGLFEPVDQPVDATELAALQRGDTIWLPALPPSLSWSMRIEVHGDAVVHVCSRQSG
jgi:hypothetical protein